MCRLTIPEVAPTEAIALDDPTVVRLTIPEVAPTEASPLNGLRSVPPHDS